ncbi:unnamed protein product, partial [Didymodactylos carnosus]
DVVKRNVIAKLIPHLCSQCKIYNTYGPAETTITATYHLIERSDGQSSIPIGLPLPNYQCYVLDEHLQPVVLNAIGELYIGGAGVCYDYFNRPDLTKQALISNIPGITNRKCYRTGDLVKVGSDGLLYFLGRNNFQVKLHGQRLELGEIESIILQSSNDISNCIVIKVNDEKTKQDYLVAYISTTNRSLESHVKQYCQSYLATYMVPSIFILLDRLPLNENRKVDRKQLPKPNFSLLQEPEEFIEPKTVEEVEIHRLWCEALGLDKISLTQNFFSAGGTSLLLIKLLNHYKIHFSGIRSTNLNITTLFQQTTIEAHARLIEPKTVEEVEIHRLWCEALGLDKISLTQNFFSAGGTSLLLIKLLNHYKIHFSGIRSTNLNITTLFQQTTIEAHARLVQANMSLDNNNLRSDVKHQLKRFHVTEAVASSAQERIWTDEQVRFDSDNQLAIYNIPIILKVIEGPVSISRLRNALLTIIHKHSILRTKLIYSPEEKCLKQYIKSMPDEVLTSNHDDYYSFEMSVGSNEQEFNTILIAEVNRHWFCLETGIVFRCHIVKHKLNNNDILVKDDAIIFNFHHSAFDGNSVKLFLSDLQDIYNDNFSNDNDDKLQYIDYAIYERQMLDDNSSDSTMKEAIKCWNMMLSDYDIYKQLLLPYDHYEKLNHTRSGRGSNIRFFVQDTIVDRMNVFANENNISMFQLLVTTYMLYLHKLTNNNDICIGVPNTSLDNVQGMIGMFVNTLPYCSKIDSHITFKDLLLKIHQLCLSVLQYSYLPLQDILKLYRARASTTTQHLPFLQTLFVYETRDYSSPNVLNFDEGKCSIIQCEDATEQTAARFDLTFTVNHDVRKHRLSCSFAYACDLFKEQTIKRMMQKFQILLEQLFSPSSSFDRTRHSLSELSILLPDQMKLLPKVNESDVGSIDNSLQYIDYSIHERQMDMQDAKHYWKQLLDGYSIDKQLA